MRAKMRQLKKRRTKQQALFIVACRVQRILEFLKTTDEVTQFQRETERWKNFQSENAVVNVAEVFHRENKKNFIKTEVARILKFQRELDAVSSFQQRIDAAVAIQKAHAETMSFRGELAKARLAESVLQSSATKIQAFQREFDNLNAFRRHLEKASAFQLEADRLAGLLHEADAVTKLAADMKRQAFLSLRHENYVASLRLEGLHVGTGRTAETLEELKAKYGQ